MPRTWKLFAAVAFLTAAGPILSTSAATAQEPEKPAAQSPAEKLKANPNDQEALNAYMTDRIQAIMGEVRTAPEKAEKLLDEMKTFLEGVKPTDEQAKALAERARSYTSILTQQIELAKTKLEDLESKLKEKLDAQTLSQYTSKVTSEISALMSEAPDKAKEQLEKAGRFIDTLEDKASVELRPRIEQARRTLASVEQRLSSELTRAELVGKTAPPISAEAWVNGPALTEEDLKGKVVLLDFWAVWCGPCIATFPHLKEWNEKYADKGLVIIGLTRYYNYDWNAEQDKAMRSEGEVSHEAEQAMLEKFAAQHGLKHVFAVQTDNELSEFYGVTGIPQAVLIDRAGKVQMIKVGSGDANAKALSEKIEELINAKDVAGE